MIISCGRRVSRADSCPTVGTWSVSAAGVQQKITAPDDHFTAGPDSGVTTSCGGRVARARGNPVVGYRIVSPTGVVGDTTLTAAGAAPHNHFTAGPDCRVKESASGHITRAGGCPTVGARIIPPADVQ